MFSFLMEVLFLREVVFQDALTKYQLVISYAKGLCGCLLLIYPLPVIGAALFEFKYRTNHDFRWSACVMIIVVAGIDMFVVRIILHAVHFKNKRILSGAYFPMFVQKGILSGVSYPYACSENRIGRSTGNFAVLLAFVVSVFCRAGFALQPYICYQHLSTAEMSNMFVGQTMADDDSFFTDIRRNMWYQRGIPTALKRL
jgi:hypothetical protein